MPVVAEAVVVVLLVVEIRVVFVQHLNVELTVVLKVVLMVVPMVVQIWCLWWYSL